MRKQDSTDKVMKKANKWREMMREERVERKGRKNRAHRRQRGGGHRRRDESRWGGMRFER